MLLEGCCRLFGVGEANATASRIAEVRSDRPLFARNDSANEFRVASNRRLYFADDAFSASKSNATRRIFVFGGSTVQGRPFSIETSFPTFLRLALQQVAPEFNWEVVNCGGISYASYRLIPLLEECSRYEPDLFVVCTGHNEFLEHIDFKTERADSLFNRTYDLAQQLHTVRAFESLLTPADPMPVAVSEEVDALLDHQGGLEAYSREGLQREFVRQGFEANLKRMVEVCRRRGIPLIMALPPSNLCNCPPFKSQFSSSSIKKQQEIASALPQAVKTADSDELQRIVDLDPAYAVTWYQLGHARLNAGDVVEAQAAFERARDEDVCPLRITTPLETTLRQVANKNRIPLLDIASQLTERSRRQIVGDDFLVDHVHPSFTTNQYIARQLVPVVKELLSLSAEPTDWESAVNEAFSDHMEKLPSMYFLSGQRTLNTLKEWTSGRADGPPLKKAKSSQ